MAVACAAQRAGLDAAALRAGGPSDAELDALFQQYTRKPLAAGVFGAPSYVAAIGRDLLGPGLGWSCWSARCKMCRLSAELVSQ